jgi:hypothetical protein
VPHVTGGSNYVRASNSIGYFLPPNLGGFYGQLQYGFSEKTKYSPGTATPDVANNSRTRPLRRWPLRLRQRECSKATRRKLLFSFMLAKGCAALHCQAVVVMVIAVAFIAFLLFQYVGDPVVFLLGQDAKPEQIRELRAALGLDQPFFVQFWHFLLNAVQGEFGLSLRQGAKVSRLIGERFPATLELALVAAALALFIGIPMGVYTALRRGTFMSQVFMTLSLLGVSLPTFLIGILLILVFAVHAGLVPELRPRRDGADRLVEQRPAQAPTAGTTSCCRR